VGDLLDVGSAFFIYHLVIYDSASLKLFNLIKCLFVHTKITDFFGNFTPLCGFQFILNIDCLPFEQT